MRFRKLFGVVSNSLFGCLRVIPHRNDKQNYHWTKRASDQILDLKSIQGFRTPTSDWPSLKYVHNHSFTMFHLRILVYGLYCQVHRTLCQMARVVICLCTLTPLHGVAIVP